MSSPLLHGPERIVAQLLVDRGWGSDPETVYPAGHLNAGRPSGAWPCYDAAEPSGPDGWLAVLGAGPRGDGRLMPDGEMMFHYGVQVQVMGRDYATAATKAYDLVKRLTEAVYQQVVTVDATDYVVSNFAGVTATHAGREAPNTKRTLFTLNATVALRRKVNTALSWGGTLLVWGA